MPCDLWKTPPHTCERTRTGEAEGALALVYQNRDRSEIGLTLCVPWGGGGGPLKHAVSTITLLGCLGTLRSLSPLSLPPIPLLPDLLSFYLSLVFGATSAFILLIWLAFFKIVLTRVGKEKNWKEIPSVCETQILSK